MKKIELNLPARVILPLCLFAACAIITGCSDDDDPASAVKVKLSASVPLGDHLTDADGFALYIFGNDASGTNMCSGSCAGNWPVYNAGDLSAADLGAGLDIDDFGTATSGGVTQTTYKGWPLYYYAPGGVREAPGNTTGEGVGGLWFVAKADYTIMIANAQLIGLDGKHYKGDYTEGDEMVRYFTDAGGRTIYAFINDRRDDNNFSNGDAAHDATWPIYGASLGSVPSLLDKGQFGTITVMGNTQLTYRGWPLYQFTNDAARGDNKGVSVPVPGVWPVVVADIEMAPE